MKSFLSVIMPCLWMGAFFLDISTLRSRAAAEASTVSITTKKRAGLDWWSLQPVRRPPLPSVSRPGWGKNPIDAFVLARLEAAGLAPGSPAEPRALVRRLYFDLVGLPPTPEEVEAFTESMRSDADRAVAGLVDRLLKSPHYGERWARHWLDVARYGESDGFEYDKLRPNGWAYRDWVIRALNEDMPYDQFVRWQIAGDVIEPQNADAIIATGFLVCGAFDGLLPQGDKMRQIMRQDEMEDLVGTVGQTFLGLTVHCARCHDHKFDPVTQKEYYQLASALAGVHRGDRELPPETGLVDLQQRIDELGEQLAALENPVRQAILEAFENGRATLPAPPPPLARWTFDEGVRDEMNSLDGELKDGARLEDGFLRLDGRDSYGVTAPLPVTLREKTLQAWVTLSGLEQRGGAAISIQSLDGNRFDAIVYGEREAGQWMAGSEGFVRTQSFQAPAETEASGTRVHVAIVYHADGTIVGYRNGRPYGRSYRSSGPAVFEAGQAQVLFGLRHGTAASAGRMLAGGIDRAELYDRALSAEEIATCARIPLIREEHITQQLTPEQRQQRDAWKRELAELRENLERRQHRAAYAVSPKEAPVAHVLMRGNPLQPGEAVSAAGVEAVRGVDGSFGLPPDAPEAERRRGLAAWVTQADNPLFARVMMNRLWHYHFGQGLVKTPNDLGFNGGLPSHPELLDWLAAEFREQGWSLKAMHWLIVTSATYRQSSALHPEGQARDADNRWLWRYAPRRLEAEVVRDTVLAVAGQLNRQVGGEGFQDFHMYNHKSSWVYDPIDPAEPEYQRRSIYRTWARGSRPPLLTALDCPDPSTTTPVRGVTTTPLSALSMLNTAFVLRLADAFAERLRREAGDDVEAQAKRGFQLAFGREPQPEEEILTDRFIREQGLSAFCRVLFNANEFLYLD